MRKGLYLRLLGGFRVERDGQPIPESAWERPTARTLVKLLAVQPSHRLHREQVMDALWPGLAPDSAVQSFRNALSRARKALEPDARRGEGRFLRTTGELVVLDHDAVAVDADQFEAMARRALTDPSGDLAQQAVDLYTGELLPEDRYEDWTVARRDDLSELHVNLLVALAERLADEQEYGAAVGYLRRVLQAAPTREDVHRLLMQIYLRQGSRHEALCQYDQCRTVIWEELAAEPEEETQALYRHIAKGSPASRVRSVARTPLPAAVAQQVSGPFLGRQAAVSLLREAMDRAGAGQGALIFISGEPGIGKSRLMAEAARRAAEGGMRVLWGGSTDISRGYGAFVSAIGDHLATLPQEERTRIVLRFPDLPLLVPSLGDAGTPEPDARTSTAESQRYVVLITQLLCHLAEKQPMFLALDDLHAADASSLALLDHLLTVVQRNALIIAGTYRLEDVPGGSILSDIVTAATRRGIGQTIGLMRLGRVEVDQLVTSLLPGGDIPRELFRHVYERALGNPLFAEALVQNLQEEGTLILEKGTWTLTMAEDSPVPPGVREIVERRVRAMHEDARRIAELMAVFGADSGFALLQRAGPFSTSALLRGLDDLLEGRVVVERENGYGFFHPLYREALYQGLSRHSRARLHLALARTLEDLGSDDVEALAYHYAGTGETRKAAAHLERAGDRARFTYANQAAESYYRQSLDRLSLLEAREDMLRVKAKLGEVLTLQGQFEAALAILDEVAHEHRRDGDIDALAQTLASVGVAYLYWGQVADGAARLRPLVDELSDGARGREPSRGIAALQIALARLLHGLGRYEEGVKLSEAARAGAEAAGDQAIAVEAEINRLSGLPNDAWREAQEGFLKVIPVAEAAGDLQAAQRAYLNLNWYSFIGGDYPTRRTALEHALEISHRMGNANYIAACLGELAAMLTTLGDWRAARRYLEAVELFASGEDSWLAVSPLRYLGDLNKLEGHLEEARQMVQRSMDMAERVGHAEAIRAGHNSLAELDILSGDPEAAIRRLEPLVDAIYNAAGTMEDIYSYRLPPMLARAYLASGSHEGRVERAEAMAARAVAHAREFERPATLADALWVHGSALAHLGRADEAEADLREALVHTDSIPSPHARAQLLFELGRLHLARGDGQQAEVALREALSIFQRLGASRDAQSVAAALSSLRDRVSA